MLRFNDDKVFVDSVDGQLVALVIETGSYYTFNEAATAVLNDLTSGYEVAEVAEALMGLAGDDALAKLDSFIEDATARGIVEECLGAAPEGRPAMSCLGLDLSGGLSFEMDGYDDVAEYFLVDPIHEVDPDTGWPNIAQE